jgi:hypothetical protein
LVDATVSEAREPGKPGISSRAHPTAADPVDPQRPVLNVQACERGGFLQSSSCTRWSPTIKFATPLVGDPD